MENKESLVGELEEPNAPKISQMPDQSLLEQLTKGKQEEGFLEGYNAGLQLLQLAFAEDISENQSLQSDTLKEGLNYLRSQGFDLIQNFETAEGSTETLGDLMKQAVANTYKREMEMRERKKRQEERKAKQKEEEEAYKNFVKRREEKEQLRKAAVRMQIIDDPLLD